jgi:hypothetical protein
MKKLLLITAAIGVLATGSLAQVRPMEKTPSKPAAKPQAPASVAVKYEGGMYGFGRKMEGTLKFDDINSRLVFYGADQKELFAIPYDAFTVIYPQSKSVTSTTGNVVKWIPLPGAGLAGFIKEKRRYLVIQFDDPDVDAKGTINFKVENKETLDAVLLALADKAGLQQRGDAYYKPRTVKKDS